MHYQSQNPDSIAMSGFNIQGKGSTKNTSKPTEKVAKQGSYGTIPRQGQQMASV